MPRTCTICARPDLEAIDCALVAGEAYRIIAKQFEASASAVYRHQQDHLPSVLALAQDAEEVARGDDLLTQVRDLQGKALGILEKAQRAGDLRTALGGVREARACLELLAKVSGELGTQPQVNVLVAPERLSIRATILMTLVPYPAAREAVLRGLDGNVG